MAQPPTSIGAGTRLALPAILTLAAVARSRSLPDVFFEGRVLPIGNDSAYHLWRIEEAVHGALAPPRFDPFLNAPDGAAMPWPDGFDFLIALVARVFAGADASRLDVQLAAFAVVLLLGLLSVLAVWALARHIAGGFAALGAATIAAVLPGFTSQATIGIVDHHVCEMLFPPLALLFILRARTRPGARSVALHGVLAGLSLAATWHTVLAAMLHVSIVCGAAFAGAAASVWRSARGSARALEARRTLLVTALALVTATSLVVPDAISRGGWVFFATSLLQPAAFAAAGVIFATLAWVAGFGGRAFFVSTAAIAVAAVAMLALVLPEIFAGLTFVGREGVLALVTESAPIWELPMDALSLASGGALVMPFALGFIAWRQRSPESVALAAMGLLAFVVFVLQLRFVTALGPPLAIALGAAIVALWRAKIHFSRGTAVLLALALLAPTAHYFVTVHWSGAEPVALYDLSSWLRKHTPSVGPRREGTRAPFTILSMWGIGNVIAYHSERPVVASAMYHGEHERGLRDALTALHGDADPNGIFERRRVRYVVVGPVFPTLERAHRRMLGLEERAARPTLHTHLYLHDGRALPNHTHPVRARSNLRLVHETPALAPGGPPKGAPYFAVFERVRGAILRGQCAGDAIVRARLALRSNLGRRFLYLEEATCVGGAFLLRVPYAGHARLEGAIGAREAILSDEDVRTGRAVEAR
jgi:dolichyl-diphosphooligosaccharide--protein glycosyltransferase